MNVFLLVASEVIAMEQPGLLFSTAYMVLLMMLATNLGDILYEVDMYQVPSPASSSHDNVPEPLMTYRWFSNCPLKDGVHTPKCNSRTAMFPDDSRCFVQSIKDASLIKTN